MKLLATLVIGLVSWTSLNAHAEILPLPTYNLSDKAIWITIYDVTTRQTDWGCVPAHSMRAWWSGNYVPVVPYTIIAEVKNTADCSGPNINVVGTPIQLPSVGWLDANFKWHTTPLPPTQLDLENANAEAQ